MSKSLNRVQLIGNLTRDPELRYTPQGTAVCTFGVATNRQWTTDSGEKKDEAEFHRIVAWAKLAEICSQYLTKGRKVFVEGRLQTRTWTGQDNVQRTTTEIVASDMIILDNRGAAVAGGEAAVVSASGDASFDIPAEPTAVIETQAVSEPVSQSQPTTDDSTKKQSKSKTKKTDEETDKKENSEDIPF